MPQGEPFVAGVAPSSLDDALQAKYALLVARLGELASVLVAYSGGVDSALLLKVAHDALGDRALGALAVSPAYDDDETAGALAVASQLGLPVVTIATREMDDPAYVVNGPDRCFHCKNELFARLAPLAVERHLAHVAYGVHVDDLGDYRPGQRAARQWDVATPLIDAGMGKNDIRALARHLGVPVWNKPALACYSSRIPYGTPVTVEALRRIARAERIVRDCGFDRVRVRHHDRIARIEVDAADLPRIVAPGVRATIEQGLRALGYLYITVDLGGYRSGSLNESLRSARARAAEPPTARSE